MKRNEWHIEDLINLAVIILDKKNKPHIAANLYEECTGVFHSPLWIRGGGCTNPVKLFIREMGETPAMVLWLAKLVK